MTSQPPVMTELHCTQCGGELHPDEGQVFLTCPYCSATVYIDKSRVVLHWYIAPTINAQQAVGELYRWMSGSQTVKDLDKKARVTSQAFQYFPLWYCKYKGNSGEEIALQPAAATSITEMKNLHLPAGDFRKYDSSIDSQAQAPTVPLSAAQEWVRGTASAQAPVKRLSPMVGSIPSNSGDALITEMSLVHVPVFVFKYIYNGQTFTALVDAASGTVLANLFPHKREAPYLIVGIVTALVFLCLAVIPLGFAATNSGNQRGIGIGVCIGGGIIAAPILFAWAFWVASKI